MNVELNKPVGLDIPLIHKEKVCIETDISLRRARRTFQRYKYTLRNGCLVFYLSGAYKEVTLAKEQIKSKLKEAERRQKAELMIVDYIDKMQ